MMIEYGRNVFVVRCSASMFRNVRMRIRLVPRQFVVIAIDFVTVGLNETSVKIEIEYLQHPKAHALMRG